MHRDNASLIDISNAVQRVLAFTAGLPKAALAKNHEKQSAVLYQIIIVGKATRRLSLKSFYD
ncbi:hypothetical protein Lepto7375DRAFT_7894 [Leptolyngbya sp. PCC 7375]|nr:hypothetical protein Lepto7375DRAFT_7894 [Leptolyngbya sp. PCC 7375]